MSNDPFKDFGDELDRRLKNVFNDVNAAVSAAQQPVPPPPPVPAAPFEYATPFDASQTPLAATAAPPSQVPPPAVQGAAPSTGRPSPLAGAWVGAPAKPVAGDSAPQGSLENAVLPRVAQTTVPPPPVPAASAPDVPPPLPPPPFVPAAVGIPVSVEVKI